MKGVRRTKRPVRGGGFADLMASSSSVTATAGVITGVTRNSTPLSPRGNSQSQSQTSLSPRESASASSDILFSPRTSQPISPPPSQPLPRAASVAQPVVQPAPSPPHDDWESLLSVRPKRRISPQKSKNPSASFASYPLRRSVSQASSSASEVLPSSKTEHDLPRLRHPARRSVATPSENDAAPAVVVDVPPEVSTDSSYFQLPPEQSSSASHPSESIGKHTDELASHVGLDGVSDSPNVNDNVEGEPQGEKSPSVTTGAIVENRSETHTSPLTAVCQTKDEPCSESVVDLPIDIEDRSPLREDSDGDVHAANTTLPFSISAGETPTESTEPAEPAHTSEPSNRPNRTEPAPGVPSFLSGWDGADGWGDDPIEDSDPDVDLGNSDDVEGDEWEKWDAPPETSTAAVHGDSTLSEIAATESIKVGSSFGENLPDGERLGSESSEKPHLSASLSEYAPPLTTEIAAGTDEFLTIPSIGPSTNTSNNLSCEPLTNAPSSTSTSSPLVPPPPELHSSENTVLESHDGLGVESNTEGGADRLSEPSDLFVDESTNLPLDAIPTTGTSTELQAETDAWSTDKDVTERIANDTTAPANHASAEPGDEASFDLVGEDVVTPTDDRNMNPNGDGNSGPAYAAYHGTEIERGIDPEGASDSESKDTTGADLKAAMSANPKDVNTDLEDGADVDFDDGMVAGPGDAVAGDPENNIITDSTAAVSTGHPGERLGVNPEDEMVGDPDDAVAGDPENDISADATVAVTIESADLIGPAIVMGAGTAGLSDVMGTSSADVVNTDATNVMDTSPVDVLDGNSTRANVTELDNVWNAEPENDFDVLVSNELPIESATEPAAELSNEIRTDPMGMPIEKPTLEPSVEPVGDPPSGLLDTSSVDVIGPSASRPVGEDHLENTDSFPVGPLEHQGAEHVSSIYDGAANEPSVLPATEAVAVAVAEAVVNSFSELPIDSSTRAVIDRQSDERFESTTDVSDVPVREPPDTDSVATPADDVFARLDQYSAFGTGDQGTSSSMSHTGDVSGQFRSESSWEQNRPVDIVCGSVHEPAKMGFANMTTTGPLAEQEIYTGYEARGPQELSETNGNIKAEGFLHSHSVPSGGPALEIAANPLVSMGKDSEAQTESDFSVKGPKEDLQHGARPFDLPSGEFPKGNLNFVSEPLPVEQTFEVSPSSDPFSKTVLPPAPESTFTSTTNIQQPNSHHAFTFSRESDKTSLEGVSDQNWGSSEGGKHNMNSDRVSENNAKSRTPHGQHIDHGKEEQDLSDTKGVDAPAHTEAWGPEVAISSRQSEHVLDDNYGWTQDPSSNPAHDDWAWDFPREEVSDATLPPTSVPQEPLQSTSRIMIPPPEEDVRKSQNSSNLAGFMDTTQATSDLKRNQESVTSSFGDNSGAFPANPEVAEPVGWNWAESPTSKPNAFGGFDNKNISGNVVETQSPHDFLNLHTGSFNDPDTLDRHAKEKTGSVATVNPHDQGEKLTLDNSDLSFSQRPLDFQQSGAVKDFGSNLEAAYEHRKSQEMEHSMHRETEESSRLGFMGASKEKIVSEGNHMKSQFGNVDPEVSQPSVFTLQPELVYHHENKNQNQNENTPGELPPFSSEAEKTGSSRDLLAGVHASLRGDTITFESAKEPSVLTSNRIPQPEYPKTNDPVAAAFGERGVESFGNSAPWTGFTPDLQSDCQDAWDWGSPPFPAVAATVMNQESGPGHEVQDGELPSAAPSSTVGDSSGERQPRPPFNDDFSPQNTLSEPSFVPSEVISIDNGTDSRQTVNKPKSDSFVQEHVNTYVVPGGTSQSSQSLQDAFGAAVDDSDANAGVEQGWNWRGQMYPAETQGSFVGFAPITDVPDFSGQSGKESWLGGEYKPAPASRAAGDFLSNDVHPQDGFSISRLAPTIDASNTETVLDSKPDVGRQSRRSSDSKSHRSESADTSRNCVDVAFGTEEPNFLSSSNSKQLLSEQEIDHSSFDYAADIGKRMPSEAEIKEPPSEAPLLKMPQPPLAAPLTSQSVTLTNNISSAFPSTEPLLTARADEQLPISLGSEVLFKSMNTEAPNVSNSHEPSSVSAENRFPSVPLASMISSLPPVGEQLPVAYNNQALPAAHDSRAPSVVLDSETPPVSYERDARSVLHASEALPAPQFNQTLPVPQVRAAPSVSLVREAPPVSHTNETAPVLRMGEALPAPHVGGAPLVPRAGEAPLVPHVGEAPPVPHVGVASPVPHEASPAPRVVEAPPVPHIVETPPVPHMSEAPTFPHVGGSPPVLHMAEAPPVPHMGEAPSFPHVGEIPPVPHTIEPPSAPPVNEVQPVPFVSDAQAVLFGREPPRNSHAEETPPHSDSKKVPCVPFVVPQQRNVISQKFHRSTNFAPQTQVSQKHTDNSFHHPSPNRAVKTLDSFPPRSVQFDHQDRGEVAPVANDASPLLTDDQSYSNLSQQLQKESSGTGTSNSFVVPPSSSFSHSNEPVTTGDMKSRSAVAAFTNISSSDGSALFPSSLSYPPPPLTSTDHTETAGLQDLRGTGNASRAPKSTAMKYVSDAYSTLPTPASYPVAPLPPTEQTIESASELPPPPFSSGFAYPFSIMDPSVTNDVEHRTLCPIISWGFGGTLVMSIPPAFDSSDEGKNVNGFDSRTSYRVKLFELQTISFDVQSEDLSAAREAVPPHRLPISNQELSLLAETCDRVSLSCSGLSRHGAEGSVALWRLLALMCRERDDGWRSSATSVLSGLTSVRMFGRKKSGSISASKEQSPFNDSSRPSLGSDADHDEAGLEVERLMSEGNGTDALRIARESGMWPIAFVLASTLDKSKQNELITDFARSTLKESSTLYMLCLAMAENFSEIEVKATSAAGLGQWRKTVGILLANWKTSTASGDGRATKFLKIIDKVGQELLLLKKDSVSAHICFLLSGSLGALSTEGTMLLGADRDMLAGRPRSYGSTAAILQSLVFEAVCCSQGQEMFYHLLPFRFLLAFEVCCVGRPDVALAHCEWIVSIVKGVFQSGRNEIGSTFTLPFLASLEALDLRLRKHLGVSDQKSKTGTLTTLRNSLSSVFSRKPVTKERGHESTLNNSNLSRRPESDKSKSRSSPELLSPRQHEPLAYSNALGSQPTINNPPMLSMPLPAFGAQSHQSVHPQLQQTSGNHSQKSFHNLSKMVQPSLKTEATHEALENTSEAKGFGGDKWSSLMSKTVGILAPAGGDLSPPPRTRSDDHIPGLSQPLLGGRMGGPGSGFMNMGGPGFPAMRASSSTGDMMAPVEDYNPPILSSGGSAENVPTRDYMQSSDGGRSRWEHMSSQSGNRAIRDSGEGSSSTAISKASDKKPPLPPKSSSSTEVGNNTVNSVPRGWRARIAERLLSTFGSSKRAHMGEKNKFVYDEKLGRWVIPGEEVPEDSSLPPPPPDDNELSGQGTTVLSSSVSYDDVLENTQRVVHSNRGDMQRSYSFQEDTGQNAQVSAPVLGAHQNSQNTLVREVSTTADGMVYEGMHPGANASLSYHRAGVRSFDTGPSQINEDDPSNIVNSRRMDQFFGQYGHEVPAPHSPSTQFSRAPTQPSANVPPTRPVGPDPSAFAPPASNKYRAGMGRLSGKRAYVDTFNKGSKGRAHGVMPPVPGANRLVVPTPAPTMGLTRHAGDGLDNNGGYHIFTPNPQSSFSHGHSDAGLGGDSTRTSEGEALNRNMVQDTSGSIDDSARSSMSGNFNSTSTSAQYGQQAEENSQWSNGRGTSFSEPIANASSQTSKRVSVSQRSAGPKYPRMMA